MLLFLHGFLGSKEDWGPLLSHFGRGGIAVTLPLLASDIPAALFTLYPRADLLVGYSAGGRIALEMQARFSGAYRRVVAISAHPGLIDPALRLARKQQDQRWIAQLKKGPFPAFLQQWYAQPLFAPFRTSSAYRAALQRRLRQNPAHWARFLETHGIGGRPPFAIASSTTFICGSKDLKYATLYRRLQSSTIAGAGHVVHLEQPARCAALLEEIADDNR